MDGSGYEIGTLVVKIKSLQYLKVHMYIEMYELAVLNLMLQARACYTFI